MEFNKQIKTLIIFVLLGITLTSRAQQDPMYSQYMFNIQAYNPAYAGTWNKLGVMALGRKQWVGFEGAPTTYTLTAQAPLSNNNVGVGLTIINDKIGFINRFSTFADYSYRLKFNQYNIRLGIKGGFTNYQHNLSEYILVDASDPVFRSYTNPLILLNVGIGTFIHSDNFYTGFSIPQLLKNENQERSNIIEASSISVIAGYVLPINQFVKFKPSTMVRIYPGMKAVTDINASFLIFDRLWIGGLYRFTDSFGMGINTNLLVNDNLRIGYAYDFTKNSNLIFKNNGTHEIMISYEFEIAKTRYMSPRYF